MFELNSVVLTLTTFVSLSSCLQLTLPVETWRVEHWWPFIYVRQPSTPPPTLIPQCVHFGAPYRDSLGALVTGCHSSLTACPADYECYSSMYDVSGCCMKYARPRGGPTCPRGLLYRYASTQIFVACKSTTNCPSGYECLPSIEAPDLERVCCGLDLEPFLEPNKMKCANGKEPFKLQTGLYQECSYTRSDTLPCPRKYDCISGYCCPGKDLVCLQIGDGGFTCSPNQGPLIGTVTRYHYDNTAFGCKAFQYYGCGGNLNNFLTIPECLTTCNYTSDLLAATFQGK